MHNSDFWKASYNRNIKKMIGICFRYIPNLEIAQDLAHDAFLKAIDKSETFKGTGNFDAWLRRITVNTAIQYTRDKQKRTTEQKELFISQLEHNEKSIMEHFTINELRFLPMSATSTFFTPSMTMIFRIVFMRMLVYIASLIFPPF